ncbi:MAG: hypothetical protein RLZZ337_364 [Bacteroidota bacterium]|jgi:para-aminobenzoate synthetase component 1
MNRIENYIKSFGLGGFKNLCYTNAMSYDYVSILDSCQLNTGVTGGKYELLAAFGAKRVYKELDAVQNDIPKTWLFGILSYDLKNKFENLASDNKVHIDTPEFIFFEPELLISIDKSGNVAIIGELQDSFFDITSNPSKDELNELQTFSTKEEYFSKINDIHNLILDGEVYELNYCLPFVQEFEQFSPTSFHKKLLQKSPVPMASYLKVNHLHLCGASMERYICMRGDKLISQPIKGTIKKGQSVKEDEALIHQLENSEKDRAENVMIVDLVRNDLARICESGSIKVDELFGIYSYLQVHQMISTVTGIKRENISLYDILVASFPMGSMTGAPKIASMKHIEQLESFKRGWYSGAVGYIEPSGDFDFNVVIRSLICDEKSKKMMYCAGGAITIDSNAQDEWEEIKLKTKAIADVLGN